MGKPYSYYDADNEQVEGEMGIGQRRSRRRTSHLHVRKAEAALR